MPDFFENPKAFFAKLTTLILTVLCLFLPAKTDALTLTITNDSITTQTDVIHVQITNNTRREISVSDDETLTLEMKVGDEWTRVPVKEYDDGGYYTGDWYSYYPGQSFEKSFSVSRCIVPILVPGEYRLSFDYEVKTNFNSSEEVPATAYVEFTVAE
ncbi:MAG: immunoglobulin-like domain-containing protein [Acutalibacteraceae bacterium]